MQAAHPSRALTLLAFLFGSMPAYPIDKIGFEYGKSAGDAEIDRYGATATIDWSAHWLQSGSWYLGGYWEAGVNFWDSNPGRTGNDSLVDVYMMPVLRWQRDPASGFAPFLELGTGPHGHTESEIEDKDFDIGFSFGSHVGGGVRLGESGRYEFLYRFQHLSNAGIGEKNPGINFHLFEFGYRF
ncbi:MAG: acyloxyacyl hydrolase [Gammaproteobacteria bacterium]|nr:acyloxyacyl hydrolase [Gammaproteobacteria bacterium]